MCFYVAYMEMCLLGIELNLKSSAGEIWSDGGRLYVQEKATPDHDALLHLSQYTAVQEEDGAVGAVIGIYAGTGLYSDLMSDIICYSSS